MPLISLEALFNFLLQFVPAVATAAVLWGTLNGKLEKQRKDQELQATQVKAQLDRELKEQEAKAAQIALDSAKEATALLITQNLAAIQRLDQRNKDLDIANRERDARIDTLQAASDKLHELNIAKDEKIAALERSNHDLETKLEITSVSCKAEIEKVLAELVMVRADLARALEGKGRAEAEAKAATQVKTTDSTSTGQIAEGTVQLEVKNKKEP